MDQILGRLREGKLIESTRGRSGGYRLARAASTISVHEIFTAVEDAFEPVQCLGTTDHAACGAEHVCSSKDAWSQISGAIRQTLSGIILSDIAAHKASSLLRDGSPEPLQECRAPRRRSAAGSSVAAAERSV
jgi:Rrf2 family protein